MFRYYKTALASAGLWVCLGASAAVPSLAELSWQGRLGSGTIVYDRNALDGVGADGRGSFLDAIVNFKVGGIRLPYGGDSIVLEGTGGSILTRDIVTPCGFFQNCASSSLSFLLGRSHANDPLSYKLTVNLPFSLDTLDRLPLSADGSLPPFDEGQSFNGWIRNEFNSPSGNFLTGGFGTSVTHRLLSFASPVPEPGAFALFGLGAGLMGFFARRRRTG